MAVDNTGARDTAYNPEHHSKMKHVARRHFFVREMVEDMRIRVPFVSTIDNLADFFTKPLPAKSFYPMRDKNNHERAHTSLSHRPAFGPRGGVERRVA